ncbi:MULTISPECIES: hypothetical protein [unclassified Microbacterium]|uniref:hypothetical protein n=1 Tax=unclassified Microbacterium TaxID=2609290 RepID=UPI0030163F52
MPESPDATAPEDEERSTPDEIQPDSSRTTWWPFAIVLVLGAALLIVLARRGHTKRAWDERLEATHADLRWLEQTLVPQVLAQATSAEAGAAWSAGKTRVLLIDEELYALQTADIDENRVRRAADDLRALRDLVDAVNVETSADEALDAESLRVRRATVELKRAHVRARLGGA